MSRWSTSSLLIDLAEQLTRSTPDFNLERLPAVIHEIAARGLDVDGLIRVALGPTITYSIVMATSLAELWPEGRTAEVPTPPVPAGWAVLLDRLCEEPGEQKEDRSRERFVTTLTGPFTDLVMRWLQTAPLDAVIAWTPPETANQPDGFNGGRVTNDEHEDAERLGWILDRFTKTYYDEWRSTSLRLEYRFVLGEEPAPCADALMTERAVDHSKLAETLAVDTALKARPGEAAFLAMKRWAIDLLIQGRRADAATVLDGARRLDWQGFEPHNDYGFCLIPDDPAAALAALQLASSLGDQRTVNAANRVLCMFLTGKYEDALTLAEEIVANYASADSGESLLWDPKSCGDGGQPEIIYDAVPREYLLELAVRCAGHVSAEKHARWTSLQVELAADHA